MINVRIEGVGFDAIQARYRFAGKQPSAIISPGLSSIANHLADSVREELRGGQDPHGFVWHGNLLNSVDTKNISPNEADVFQDDAGNFILYGTSGNATAKPSPNLVDWAQSKLGLDRSEAFAVGQAILRKGILAESRAHQGGKGFNYADYIVNVKEQGYLENAGNLMGTLIVKYLDTGA